ncbi:MAG: hypothetical protein SGJ11_03055 [Phycisphaerae bacterium]|nr:hypothetical protein [Phycisphaerae bacterium]
MDVTASVVRAIRSWFRSMPSSRCLHVPLVAAFDLVLRCAMF